MKKLDSSLHIVENGIVDVRDILVKAEEAAKVCMAA